jgi:cyclophilin family peptidyl-prolyl cis-trans isomerase
MEFFPNAAPNHVDNFINLVNGGFYDWTLGNCFLR